MSTYKNLKIYKTHDDAARAAANQGFKFDASKYYNHDHTDCECGETEIAVFWPGSGYHVGKEIAFGICESCGEEY